MKELTPAELAAEHAKLDQLLDDAAKYLSTADLLEFYKYLVDKCAANATWGKPTYRRSRA